VRCDAEVAVVGAGIMGLATAHALAAQGRDVVVLEQFRVGHKRGSSHGATRIFRLAYPDPAWVRLALESLAGWRRLESASGIELVSLVGLVELVEDLAQSSQRALDSCGIACRILDAGEAHALFGLRVPESFTALLQPDAGIVYAERAHAAFGAGLAVTDGVRVAGLRRKEDGVRLETSAGSLHARAVVVTAGAWARPLLATDAIELEVQPTRETVAYFGLVSAPHLPAVAEFASQSRRHAFYALTDPVHGLKAGFNGSGPVTDPDEVEDPDPEIVSAIAAWASARLPLARPQPLHVETCLYTNTADESFVLDRRGRVVVGSACSGHGFKFAPVVGLRLAALATEALA
jgi:sarcosine oxidase